MRVYVFRLRLGFKVGMRFEDLGLEMRVRA